MSGLGNGNRGASGKCQGSDVVKRCADCTGTRQATGLKVKVICNSPLLGMLRTFGSCLAPDQATAGNRPLSNVQVPSLGLSASCHALNPLPAGLVTQLRYDGRDSGAVGQCSKALSNLQVLEFDPI